MKKYKYLIISAVALYVLAILVALAVFGLKLGIEAEDPALEGHNRSIEENPDDASVYYKRAFVHEKLGNDQEALADYGQVIESSPYDAYAYKNRAIVHKRLRNYEEALADYNQAIELESGWASTYYNRASLHEELGNYQEALADYEQVIALDPNYPTASKKQDKLNRLLNKRLLNFYIF